MKEIIQGLGWNEGTQSRVELQKLSRTLSEGIQCRSLLLTLSERGMLFSSGDTFGILPAMPRNIVDVSGAGDTVLAVACACLCLGADIETAAYLSNMAGGLVCEKLGVVPINQEELIRAIRRSK